MTESVSLTAAGWSMLGVGAALGVVAMIVALRGPGDGRLARWAGRYGLDPTGVARPVVVRYLRLTLALQVAGATVGWVSAPLYSGLSGRPFPLGDNWVALAVGGYLLGAVAAESIVGRAVDVPGGVRFAALTPRAVADYVPGITTWALRIAPLLMLALAAVYALLPGDPLRDGRPSVIVLGAGSVMALGFALAVEWFLRAIAVRPQPVQVAELVATDDAIRASSMQALSAGAVALVLLGCGWALASIGTATSNGALQVLTSLGAVTDLLAVAAWLGLGRPRTWRVRRRASMDRAG